jgi:quercetin dioxygenase-like cupin family protein
MSSRGLPPVRRIVTGHDATGRAIFKDDRTFTTAAIPGGDAEFALIWTTATVPADNDDETDGREREAGLTLERGSVIRVVDMLPGGESPMHRTNSIDYGIVLSGEVELELDDGVKTVARPGDVVVQRGTIHLWRNVSATVPCRIVFVLIQASPATVGGTPLEQLKP